MVEDLDGSDDIADGFDWQGTAMMAGYNVIILACGIVAPFRNANQKQVCCRPTTGIRDS